MKPRKAVPPASQKARKRVPGVSFAKSKSPEAKPENFIMQAVAVYDGSRCIGFVMPRGRQGYEAFDIDTRPIGRFQTQAAAADAVARRAGAP